MTQNTPHTHVAEIGTDCPAFVAERVFDAEPRDQTHHADIGEATISMVVGADGGIVVFDDGETIYRRLFDDLERAVEVFRGTVVATVAEYDSRGLEFDTSYSAGAFDVELDLE